MKRNDYTVPCPICGHLMKPRPHRCPDGWHDFAQCCERTWDVCCQEEFERMDWLRVVAAHAQGKEHQFSQGEAR